MSDIIGSGHVPTQESRPDPGFSVEASFRRWESGQHGIDKRHVRLGRGDQEIYPDQALCHPSRNARSEKCASNGEAIAAVGERNRAEREWSYGPLRVGLIQAFLASGLVGMTGVLAFFEITQPWRYAVGGVTLLIVAGAVRRAFRVSLTANADRVIVQNFWRAHEFSWLEVTTVGLGERSAGDTTMPALASFLRNGRAILAHATPDRADDRRPVVASLEALAPPGVEFLWREHARSLPVEQQA